MYTKEEYKKILQMSSKKRVLVEGRDDHYLLSALFEEVLGEDWNDIYNIEIERSDTLLIGAPGVRQRIEEIVDLVSKTKLREKLTGFVDREFRGFDWQKEKIIDSIQSHFTKDRILWTRGHSAENYFLDESILKIPLRDASGEEFQKAYAHFKKIFNSCLQEACKVSLAAYQLNYLTRIRPSLGWNVIKSNGTLNLDEWKNQLRKCGFVIQDIENIISTYHLFEDVINATDLNTTKWICDGHISFAYLWCAFARCVYESTESYNDKKANAQRVLRANSEMRFNPCASSWARFTQSNSYEYPKDIFSILQIKPK